MENRGKFLNQSSSMFHFTFGKNALLFLLSTSFNQSHDTLYTVERGRESQDLYIIFNSNKKIKHNASPDILAN